MSRCSTSDGRALEWWTDIAQDDRIVRALQPPRRRHVAALARRVRADRARYPGARGPLAAAAAAGAARAAGTQQRRPAAAGGERAVAAANSSQQEFEHPTIKAGLLFFNGLREVDLRLPGFGHHIAALLASPAKAQMSRGGTAALARALEAAVRDSGGEISADDRAEAHLVEGGRAVGVETAEGELIRARHFVASSLNPHQTFLDLLDDALVPREIRERAESFQYNLLAPLFALHLNLREPPRYPPAPIIPNWRGRSW